MIDNLRKKIFWLIQIPLSIIIIGVILLFTTSSYKNTIKSSTMFMERLENEKYLKIDYFKENVDEIKDDFFLVKLEGVYKYEIYDNIILNKSDNATSDITQLVEKIINKKQEEGYIDKYVYKIRKFGESRKEIVLMENEEAIKRLKNTLIYAFSIGIFACLSIYIVAQKISKTIVKPVEQSFIKQKQFISDASHELKTPLAVIEANTDVLQDKVGENKWISYIQTEIQSMNKLVNDLLTLAKFENNNEIVCQKFDLSKEVEFSIAVFESLIFEKKIILENNIDKNIEFCGDKEDIKHIVSIIMDNAIKHTEPENKIIVNVQKENNNVKIEIKNQGKPIPVDEQEKIFERFYRVDKSRNRSEKRYGLGLSIAKKIVEKYNGIIKATSKDGYTSFIVKLNSK